jgi:hypothetical protein
MHSKPAPEEDGDDSDATTDDMSFSGPATTTTTTTTAAAASSTATKPPANNVSKNGGAKLTDDPWFDDSDATSDEFEEMCYGKRGAGSATAAAATTTTTTTNATTATTTTATSTASKAKANLRKDLGKLSEIIMIDSDMDDSDYDSDVEVVSGFAVGGFKHHRRPQRSVKPSASNAVLNHPYYQQQSKPPPPSRDRSGNKRVVFDVDDDDDDDGIIDVDSLPPSAFTNNRVRYNNARPLVYLPQNPSLGSSRRDHYSGDDEDTDLAKALAASAADAEANDAKRRRVEVIDIDAPQQQQQQQQHRPSEPAAPSTAVTLAVVDQPFDMKADERTSFLLDVFDVTKAVAQKHRTVYEKGKKLINLWSLVDSFAESLGYKFTLRKSREDEKYSMGAKALVASSGGSRISRSAIVRYCVDRLALKIEQLKFDKVSLGGGAKQRMAGNSIMRSLFISLTHSVSFRRPRRMPSWRTTTLLLPPWSASCAAATTPSPPWCSVSTLRTRWPRSTWRADTAWGST